VNSEIKDKQRKFISPYNTTTNKINFSTKIYCMMKKKPNLSQKKPKRTLSENKMVHAGKIMLQSTTTH